MPCVRSGVSDADAAAALGIAEPGVRSRVSRATSCQCFRPIPQ